MVAQESGELLGQGHALISGRGGPELLSAGLRLLPWTHK